MTCSAYNVYQLELNHNCRLYPIKVFHSSPHIAAFTIAPIMRTITMSEASNKSTSCLLITLVKVMHQGSLSNQVDDKSEDVLNKDLENGIARGYIHNVSPLRNNSSYFDFEVQTKYKTIRAVCFSPKKRKLFDIHSKNETPVELKKCRLETKYNSEDLVLNDDVEIKEFPEVDFCKKDLPTNFTISTLKSVSVGQLVTIKAKVVAKSPTQQVSSGQLSLVEAQVIDYTGCIKVVLWEEFQNNVEQERIFNNVRLKKNSSSNEIYLNTAKGDKTTITPTEPFQVPLAIPISMYDCHTPTREAEILAVEKLNSYFSCFKCQRKVQTSPDSSIAKCNNCNIHQKIKACKQKWIAHVLFSFGHENIVLTLFDNIFQLLIKDRKLSPQVTESQMTKILLTILNVKSPTTRKRR